MLREREVSLPPKNCIKRKNTERKSSVMKYRQFGYKFKAIFCPLTSGKDYATISPTKRKNFGVHEKSPVTRYCFEFCHGTIDYKGRTSQNSLLFTKRFDWFHSGAARGFKVEHFASVTPALQIVHKVVIYAVLIAREVTNGAEVVVV